MTRLDTDDFLQYVSDYVRRTSSRVRSTRLATIDRNFNPASFKGGWNPKLIFDGEDEPTNKRYPVVSPYWPYPGDRVLVQPVGKRHYVVTGAVETHDIQTGKSSVLPGNMATGVESISGDGTESEIEYGPLTGTGSTQVFTTVTTNSDAVIVVHTASVTESSAVLRLVQPGFSSTRFIHWMAVRGLG